MAPCIDNNDLGVELSDLVDLFFGGNQEFNNEVGNALEKKRNKALRVK